MNNTLSQHWAMQLFKADVDKANKIVLEKSGPLNCDDVEQVNKAIATYELALHGDEPANSLTIEEVAKATFWLYNSLPIPEDIIEQTFYSLSLACTALVSGCFDEFVKRETANRSKFCWDAARTSSDWETRLTTQLCFCWLNSFRQQKDAASKMLLIADLLIQEQSQYEEKYLSGQKPNKVKFAALRLVSCYHWAAASKVFVTNDSLKTSTHLRHAFNAMEKGGTFIQVSAMQWLLLATQFLQTKQK